MDIQNLFISYIFSLFFWLWVLKMGGAKWLEGWKAFALVSWFAGDWSAEQIRLYAFTAVILETILAFIGLIALISS